MKGIRGLVLITLLFLPTVSGTSTNKKVFFPDRIQQMLTLYLERNKERIILAGGRPYRLTDNDLERISWYSWEAALENPSWGHRRLVSLRWICVYAGESNFDFRCVNSHLNRDWSLDVGLAQINSVHWMGVGPTSMWAKFCEEKGYNWQKASTIMNPRANALFAARLNEHFIKIGQRTYQFDNSERRCKLYAFLLNWTGLKDPDFKPWEERK